MHAVLEVRMCASDAQLAERQTALLTNQQERRFGRCFSLEHRGVGTLCSTAPLLPHPPRHYCMTAAGDSPVTTSRTAQLRADVTPVRLSDGHCDAVVRAVALFPCGMRHQRASPHALLASQHVGVQLQRVRLKTCL